MERSRKSWLSSTAMQDFRGHLDGQHNNSANVGRKEPGRWVTMSPMIGSCSTDTFEKSTEEPFITRGRGTYFVCVRGVDGCRKQPFQLAFILAAYYSWKQRISLLFSNYVQPFPETNESASHVCKVPYHRGFWLESGRPLPSKRTSNYQQLAEQLALLARLQNSGKSEPTINGAPTWWCFCKSPESLRNIHTCCRSDFKGRQNFTFVYQLKRWTWRLVSSKFCSS